MTRRLLAASLSLLLFACASDMSDMSSSYSTLEGRILTEPQLEAKGDRLFIYLQTQSGLVVCMARNRQRNQILKELHGLLMLGMEEVVYVYGSPVDAPIEEILAGVDYQAYAVGVYIPGAKKHRVVLTNFGDSFVGAMSSVSWAEFFQKVLGKGVNAL